MEGHMINLVFIVKPKGQVCEDFKQVAKQIRQKASDISVRLLPDRPTLGRILRTPLLRFNPNLVIDMALRRDSVFQAPRGHHLMHLVSYNKADELQRLEHAGLPTPRSIILTPDTVLDPEEWGPYVVVKPSRGRRGAYAWINWN